VTARALRVVLVIGALVAFAPASAAAAAPQDNTVAQWDEIAQNTVVASGAFQNEGLVYMAYVSAAVYDAATSIEGGYEPYGSRIAAPEGASTNAAVIEAAYRTLVNYFPSPRPAAAPDLEALQAQALAAIPEGHAKNDGIAVGAAAANQVIGLRADDGRLTPIATSSPFSLAPGPGVWRLTPPAFAPPQTPWVGTVRPFVLQSGDQFLPGPPPPLSSRAWARAFAEIKAYGGLASSFRTPEQTDIARFWSTNVIAQYNQALRDLAARHGVSLLETARLMAMVNIVGADAQIAVMNAKYHYGFWRPVTAIDPTTVSASDGGPVPGFTDGNRRTVEEIGWRSLLTTPNHPEYPAAHGSLTSAMAEVFSEFLGTQRIDLAVTSTVVATTRHFERARDLRGEIVEARLWGGLHYRFSSMAGLALGRKVARYDLDHAFGPVRTCRPAPARHRATSTLHDTPATELEIDAMEPSPPASQTGRQEKR
jgi:hypothetical protein